VLAATAPFLLPYAELRQLGFNPRSLAETRHFSADVYAYFTADPNLRLWGKTAQAWPKSEWLLFPGLTIVVLAGIGLSEHRKTAEDAKSADQNVSQRSRDLPVFLIVAAALVVCCSVIRSGCGIKITSLSRVLVVCAMVGAIAPARRGTPARRRGAGCCAGRRLLRHHAARGRHVVRAGRPREGASWPARTYALFITWCPASTASACPLRDDRHAGPRRPRLARHRRRRSPSSPARERDRRGAHPARAIAIRCRQPERHRLQAGGAAPLPARSRPARPARCLSIRRAAAGVGRLIELPLGGRR
jgi:hypothetical protein